MPYIVMSTSQTPVRRSLTTTGTDADANKTAAGKSDGGTSSTQSADEASSTQSDDEASSTQSDDVASSTQSDDVASSTQSAGGVSSTQSAGGVSSTQSTHDAQNASAAGQENFLAQADPQIADRLESTVTRALKGKVTTISAQDLQQTLAPLLSQVHTAIETIQATTDLSRRQRTAKSRVFVEVEALMKETMSLRDKADKAMKAFGELSADDIARAMHQRHEGFGAPLKNVRIYKTIRAAVNTQLALAENLHGLSRKFPLVQGLIDLSLTCSARASEIQAVAVQLGTIDLKGESLDSMAAELLPARAATMHGTPEALALMKRGLTPFVDKITALRDRVASGAHGSTTSMEITDLGTQLQNARRDLDLAMREGIVYRNESKITVTQDGVHIQDRAIRPDVTTFAALSSYLDDVDAQYQRLASDLLTTTAANLAHEVLPDLDKVSLFSDLGELAKLPLPYFKSHPTTEPIALLKANLAEFRDHAQTFATATADFATAVTRSTPPNTSFTLRMQTCLQTLKQTYGEIRKECGSIYEMAKLGEQLLFLRAALKRDSPVNPREWEEMSKEERQIVQSSQSMDPNTKKNILASLDEAVQTGALSALASLVPHGILSSPLERRMNAVVGRLRSAATQFHRQPARTNVDDKILQDIMDGRMFGLDTYIGARAWNVEQDLVDPDVDDRNLVDAQVLGSGNFNTTFLLTYRTEDGRSFQRVFKPEFPGEEALQHMLLGGSGSYVQGQEIFHLNVAAQKVAALLGTPKTIAKSTMGVHNGQFGFFMERAPGRSPYDAVQKRQKDRWFGDMSVHDLQKLSHRQSARFLGTLMQKLNDLMWNDIITGQGDRHGGNYMVAVSPDLSVDVTGIDNDSAFPTWRLGAATFRIDRGERMRWFLELCKNPEYRFLSSQIDTASFMNQPANVIAAELEKKLKGFVRVEGNSLIIDAGAYDAYRKDDQTSETLKKLQKLLHQAFGVQKCCRPVAISESMFNRLEYLHAHPEEFREALEPNLTQVQIDAAIRRLNDAWDLASQLHDAHQVYKDDDSAQGWIANRRAIFMRMNEAKTRWGDFSAEFFATDLMAKGRALR